MYGLQKKAGSFASGLFAQLGNVDALYGWINPRKTL